MSDSSVSNTILGLVNQTGIKKPVTLRLKNGGAIFNAIVCGVEMNNMKMSVNYADATSGEVRVVSLADIVDVER